MNTYSYLSLDPGENENNTFLCKYAAGNWEHFKIKNLTYAVLKQRYCHWEDDHEKLG
jgi:hypothetical protein